MSGSLLTLEVSSDQRLALEQLSEAEGRTVEQLLTQALEDYLASVRAQEQTGMDLLRKLKAYRLADPHYKKAIREFAEAEVAYADPLEGRIVEHYFAPSESAQSKNEETLSA